MKITIRKPSLLLLLGIVTATVVWTTSVVTPQQKGGRRPPPRGAKPETEDTQKLNVYADNWFSLWINGEIEAVDSTEIPYPWLAVSSSEKRNFSLYPVLQSR